MSRYPSLLPYSPHAAFKALRVLTLNGLALRPGDPIDTTGVPERRLRFLYEQRMIAPLGPDDPVPVRHAGGGQSEGIAGAAGDEGGQADGETAGAEGSAPADAAEPLLPGEAAPAEAVAAASASWRVQKAGLGGWHVVDARGAPVGPAHRTKAAAEQALAALITEG